MAQQLSLDISLKDEATFANFYQKGNEAAVTALMAVVPSDLDSCIYLWGNEGVGRSHLLQAVAHVYASNNKSLMYLPLKDKHMFAPSILDGMELLDLVAIDDIHEVTNDDQWQEALFHLYNRMQQTSAKLIVTANASPRHLDIALADLRSRLAHGLVFQLHALNDSQKLAALCMRADNRGLEMSYEVAEFLLKRLPRDMNALFATLDTLDRASIQAQRRLTIPFVRQVLST